MSARAIVIAAAAVVGLLSGCSAATPTGPSSPVGSTPSDAPTPTDTPTVAPAGPTIVDPATYPLPQESRNDGAQGVMFTSGGDGLQCAIFDPVPTSYTSAAPEFGCVVSVVGYPYPPATSGPFDSYNAFLSSAHSKAEPGNVSDATFSGDSQAPALAAGSAITWGTVTCSALAADEVRCVDATSGHGMRVSIRDYDLF